MMLCILYFTSSFDITLYYPGSFNNTTDGHDIDDDGAGYKILIGRTGTGKSYISTQLGCPRESCSGSQSCSNSTFICYNSIFHLIDTVGLDDDVHHLVEYNGNQIKLTGSTFALYDLFSVLESHRIAQARFYHVYDVNSIRDGSSIKMFQKFLGSALKCEAKRVLNKYRDIPAHTRQLRQNDVVVREGQTEGIQLRGARACTIALPADWRDALVNGDIDSFKQKVDIAHCQALKTTKCLLEQECLKQPLNPDTRDCSYTTQRSGGCSRRRWRRCVAHHIIHDTHQNPDCQIKRENANMEIRKLNEEMALWKNDHLMKLDEVTKALSVCKQKIVNVDLSCA